MNAPEREMIDEDEDPAACARIVPVYPATEGVSQKTLRKAAKAAVEQYLQYVEDPLPDYLRQQEKLQPLRWCLRQIHDPESDEFRAKARKRLVFEEFFYMQVALAMRRAETQQELGIAFPIDALTRQSEGRWGVEALGRSEEDRGDSESQHLNTSTPQRRKAAVIKKEKVDTHLFESQQEARRAGEPLWDQIHRMLPFE